MAVEVGPPKVLGFELGAGWLWPRLFVSIVRITLEFSFFKANEVQLTPQR